MRPPSTVRRACDEVLPSVYPKAGGHGLAHAGHRAVGPGRPSYCRCRHCPRWIPTIQVQTLYPGASPEVMSRTVTAPLGASSARCPGWITPSTSAVGVSIINLQFQLGLSLDVAEQEVQAAINASSSLLPARSAGAAGLCQGQPVRYAGAEPGHYLERAAADRGAEHRQHAAGARSARSAASAWSASKAGRSRPCASGNAGAGDAASRSAACAPPSAVLIPAWPDAQPRRR